MSRYSSLPEKHCPVNWGNWGGVPAQGLLARARKETINITPKDGFRMSAQRVQAVTAKSIDDFTKLIMNPIVADRKQKHLEIGSRFTLDHVGNIDEWAPQS